MYLELLPLVNAGAVALLDDDHLLRELRGLERRRGTAGRDRVDHRPGAHDDRAIAAAGALVAATVEPALTAGTWGRRRRPSPEPAAAATDAAIRRGRFGWAARVAAQQQEPDEPIVPIRDVSQSGTSGGGAWESPLDRRWR